MQNQVTGLHATGFNAHNVNEGSRLPVNLLNLFLPPLQLQCAETAYVINTTVPVFVFQHFDISQWIEFNTQSSLSRESTVLELTTKHTNYRQKKWLWNHDISDGIYNEVKFSATPAKLTPSQVGDVLAEFLPYLFSTFQTDEILQGVGTRRAVACRHHYVDLLRRVLLTQVGNLYCAFVSLPRTIARFHPSYINKQTHQVHIIYRLASTDLHCVRKKRRPKCFS